MTIRIRRANEGAIAERNGGRKTPFLMAVHARVSPGVARTREAMTVRSVAGDVLVFERRGDGFTLVGGSGQGAGWAGVVELGRADEVLVGAAWRRGTAERVAGPIPFRSPDPITPNTPWRCPSATSTSWYSARTSRSSRDSELVERAAHAVTESHGLSADNLLADGSKWCRRSDP